MADDSEQTKATETTDKSRSVNIGMGILCGALGGAVGAGVKLLCEIAAPPRPKNRKPEPAVMIEKAADAMDMDKPLQPIIDTGSSLIHWTFSIVSGAIYGGLAEVLPVATVGGGTAYGLAVWVGAHEFAMPKLGLTPPQPKLPVSEQVNEAISHVIWGRSVEVTRGYVRTFAN